MLSPDGQKYHSNEFSERRLQIRALNDRLRIRRLGGFFNITQGVKALGHECHLVIRQRIAEFDDFNFNNDPFGEHDFGKLTVDGHKLFWKIDYFDINVEYHSPDPADPKVTRRSLTIMLASEY